MQPLENKRTKIQTGVARARLLIKRDMAWLPGYPLIKTNSEAESKNVLPWRADLPQRDNVSQPWSIEREHLRRAQMTLSKLRHRFPHALPRIVDDVEDWLRRIDFLVSLVKGFVHHGQTFCGDDVLRSEVFPVRWTQEVSRMKTTHRPLAEMLDAVTFLALSSQRTCELDSLAWIDKYAAELTLLAGVDSEHFTELPICMLSVREHLSSELIRVLVRCFTDPLIGECRWKQADGLLRELRKKVSKAAKQQEFDFPQNPRGETLAQLIRTVFSHAYSSRPKLGRNRFQLLEQILNAELIDLIAEKQRQIVASEEEMFKLLRRLVAPHQAHPQTNLRYREIKKKVAATAEIAGVQDATVTALGNCLNAQKNLAPMETRVWIDFLSGFPRAYVGLSVRLLDKWWQSWHCTGDNQKHFVRVIKALSALVKRRGIAPSLLKHWSNYVDEKHTCSEIIEDTSDELAGASNLEIRTVRLLETVAYDLQLDLGTELLSSMVEFAQATDDDQLSCSLIEHLAKKPDANYDANELRLAYYFGDSIDSIAGLVTALQRDHERTQLATQLKPLADDQEMKRIVAKCLAENDVSVLSRIAATTAILRNINQPPPRRPHFEQPANWMNRYPNEFHSALESLGQATNNAPSVADSVLGKAFPSPENMRQEIGALESKLADGIPEPTVEVRLRGRLANLRRRETQADQLSPARRVKLIEKLKKRTELEILNHYATTSRLQAAAAMRQRFNLSSIPDEWLQPPLDRVLREIIGLKSPMQELGIRLVFETLERTTRNFDQEPRNVAFRERMESAGVQMEPWLSDRVRQSATTADGSPYELAFTRDVIDFLLMGFHFDTCLSPDSFNFFSTVANAVDLNKRVVYAKTKAGKVIGRCLFALNDSGEIFTYYRYSHDPRDGFADAVDQFASQLASQMRTSIATTGNVSKLVAKEWYDDGPWQTDLDWLGDEGVLANLAQELAPEDLLPGLLKAKGREFLKRRVAELAVNARVRDKTEFLQRLLDEFQDEMSVRQKFTIAVNLDSATASHRLLSQLRWSDIVGLVNRYQCTECDVFHGIGEYSTVFAVLSEYNPSLALRAIRASRPSSVKNDISDPNRIRRNALAHVHRKLGREQLADKLRDSPGNISGAGIR